MLIGEALIKRQGLAKDYGQPQFCCITNSHSLKPDMAFKTSAFYIVLCNSDVSVCVNEEERKFI